MKASRRYTNWIGKSGRANRRESAPWGSMGWPCVKPCAHAFRWYTSPRLCKLDRIYKSWNIGGVPAMVQAVSCGLGGSPGPQFRPPEQRNRGPIHQYLSVLLTTVSVFNCFLRKSTSLEKRESSDTCERQVLVARGKG